MLEIPITKQINDGINYKCGAHALQAILTFYNYSISVNDIWSSIRTKRPAKFEYYTNTNKLVQYSNDIGLDATLYKSCSITETLDNLDMIGQTAILCMSHKNKNDLVGHYRVFIGKKDGDYFFLDSEKEKPVRYDPQKLKEFCREKSSEVTGNIFIAFGDAKSQLTCSDCGKSIPLVLENELSNNSICVCYNCGKALNLIL